MEITVRSTLPVGRIVSTGMGGWLVRCRNRCLIRAVPNALNVAREDLVRQLKRDGWSARGGFWTCPHCNGSPDEPQRPA